MATLGDRIRVARESVGLDQAGLAERVGVEPPTVSRWESNEMRPRPKKLLQIAEVCKKSVEWLQSDDSGAMAAIQRRLEALEAQSKDDLHPIARRIVAALPSLDEKQLRELLAGINLLLDPTSTEETDNLQKKG